LEFFGPVRLQFANGELHVCRERRVEKILADLIEPACFRDIRASRSAPSPPGNKMQANSILALHYRSEIPALSFYRHVNFQPTKRTDQIRFNMLF